MPRKVISANEEKRKKRNIAKRLILVCILLLIIGIVAAALYLLYHKTGDSEAPSLLKNETGNLTTPVLPRSDVNKTANLSTPQSADELTQISTMLINKVEYLRSLGLKWCGLGIKAPSDVDLSAVKEADECVKEHDDCTEVIDFMEIKNGLKNPELCRRSHCDCDQRFYKCLKSKGDLMSEVVGFGYFTILGTKCFKEDFPIVQCKKCEYSTLSYETQNRKRCIRYEFNETEGKKYQWFDNPLYY